MRIDTAIIPGGCTKYVQPPDVCWNKPFKQKIQEYYDNWLHNGEKSYTPSGNLRAPPPEVYLQWVADAWENIPLELIRMSFKYCRISTVVDGSEDNIINVFKPDGICPNRFELLSAKRDENVVPQSLEQKTFGNNNIGIDDDDSDTSLAL